MRWAENLRWCSSWTPRRPGRGRCSQAGRTAVGSPRLTTRWRPGSTEENHTHRRRHLIRSRGLLHPVILCISLSYCQQLLFHLQQLEHFLLCMILKPFFVATVIKISSSFQNFERSSVLPKHHYWSRTFIPFIYSSSKYWLVSFDSNLLLLKWENLNTRWVLVQVFAY